MFIVTKKRLAALRVILVLGMLFAPVFPVILFLGSVVERVVGLMIALAWGCLLWVTWQTYRTYAQAHAYMLAHPQELAEFMEERRKLVSIIESLLGGEYVATDGHGRFALRLNDGGVMLMFRHRERYVCVLHDSEYSEGSMFDRRLSVPCTENQPFYCYARRAVNYDSKERSLSELRLRLLVYYRETKANFMHGLVRKRLGISYEHAHAPTLDYVREFRELLEREL